MSEEKRGPGRPKLQSAGELELQKVEKQFEDFDNSVQQLTMDRMNQAPKLEVEPQTKLSSNEIRKSTDIYLKPFRSIGSREKFNENYRDPYNFDKEYVQFIAENKEIVGETIELWTKPYAGMPAEFWKVPVNKPVWGPRYLAEQIKRKSYHRLVMEEKKSAGEDHAGTYYGQMIVDTTVERLTARPVTNNKSIFMSVNDYPVARR